MLKRKMLRDMMDYKMQFISIFLMAFIGVFVFTGMFVETNSFETTINDYYEETNLADGWVYSNYLIDEFLYYVDHLGATTQMERQLVVNSHAILENEPQIMLHFIENNTVSKFYLLEGNKLDIDDAEGVWLDKSFADARKLKIGDEISFKSNNIEIRKKIRGLGYSPEYIYYSPVASTVPNHTSTGFAYMSYKAFPSNNIPYNVLNVKFDGTPEMYPQLLSYRLSDYYTMFMERSNHHSVRVVGESISQQNSVTSVFPPIFILLSMLMLSTTMKRVIAHQRNQIGILKANGFKNYIIMAHYVVPGFLFVTLGSIFGAISGPGIFHMIANPSRMFYFKFPYWNSIGFKIEVILIVLMGVMSIIISYYSIKNIINQPPSMIIKPEAPKLSTSSFVEKFKIWKKLSFNFRWNYRNIKRNKFRAAVTIIGVIGCTVLLISGFGLYEDINESKEWYFNDVNHFESKLILDDNTNLSQVNSIAEKVNGTSIMESSIEISKNKKAFASLMVLNDNNLITITDEKHNKMEIGDEVSISKKMADDMDIKVGDTINCSVVGSDKNINIKIDKIHSSPYSQGLVMSPDKLKELGLNYTPTSIITSEHVNESIEGTSLVYLDDLSTYWDKLEETSMMIITALICFAVILALVILYNLNILSFTEMKNDIVTLKTLGFNSKFLTNLLFTQSLLFTIPGFLLGVPIGYYVLTILMPAFGNDIYLVPTISVTNMVVTFLLIMSVLIVMTLFFAHKIKKFNITDYLII